MGSLNRAELIGTLGRDPEIRNFEGGSKVATFPMATNEPAYTLQNGTQVPEQTDWHNIVCWGALARIAEGYLHKGTQVYVAGKLKTRSYDDRQGQKRYVTEIVASELVLLAGSKSSPQSAQNATGGTSAQPTQENATGATTGADTGNDLPF